MLASAACVIPEHRLCVGRGFSMIAGKAIATRVASASVLLTIYCVSLKGELVVGKRAKAGVVAVPDRASAARTRSITTVALMTVPS